MSKRNVSASTKQAFEKTRISMSPVPANDTGLIPALRARKKFNQILQCYVLTDILGFTLGFVLAWNLTRLISALFFSSTLLSVSHEYDTFRVVSYVAIAVGCLMWFQHKGHYRVRVNFWQELKNVLSTLCFAMMVNGFFQFATKNDFSRLWLMSGWVFAASAIILFRGIFRIGLRQQGLWSVPTLLVGNGATAHDTQAVLELEKAV